MTDTEKPDTQAESTPVEGESQDLPSQAYQCADKHIWIAHGKFVTDRSCPFCRKEGKKYVPR